MCNNKPPNQRLFYGQAKLTETIEAYRPRTVWVGCKTPIYVAENDAERSDKNLHILIDYMIDCGPVRFDDMKRVIRIDSTVYVRKLLEKLRKYGIPIITEHIPHTSSLNYRIDLTNKEIYMNAKKQIPAKPATKNAVKDDDFSTDYKPPVIQTVFDSITIVDDAPIYKHAEPYKYHEIFDKLKVGQGLRMASNDISKVCGAMRNWIFLRGKENDLHVKSCSNYAGDAGFGRVWMMAGKSLYPSRKKQ